MKIINLYFLIQDLNQVSANKSRSVIYVEMRAYNQNPGEFEEQAIEPPL